MPTRCASGINFQSKTHDIVVFQPGNGAAMSAEFRPREDTYAQSHGACTSLACAETIAMPQVVGQSHKFSNTGCAKQMSLEKALAHIRAAEAVRPSLMTSRIRP